VLRFIEPCLPSPADRPPSGSNWIHEIKHDGYRMMARRDPVGIRLLTRRGKDWAARYPLVVEAVNHLKVRSVLIDGEVVCCDDSAWLSSNCCASAGTPAPSSSPSTCWSWTAPICAGSRSRSARRRWPASCARARPGVRLNEHLDHPDGLTVFQHACRMSLEGIVSKRVGSRYRSGRSPDWLKFKNPAAPAAKREAEEDWGR
jgi:bifunctional non-homologous end joining protein LigD